MTENKKPVTQQDIWNDIHTKSGDLIYSNCEFRDVVSFGDKPNMTELMNKLVFTQCDFDSLNFTNFNFRSQIVFEECVFKSRLSFNNCIFQQTFWGYDINSPIVDFAASISNHQFELENLKCSDTLTLRFKDIRGEWAVTMNHFHKTTRRIDIFLEKVSQAQLGIQFMNAHEIILRFPANDSFKFPVRLGYLVADVLEIINFKNAVNNRAYISSLDATKLKIEGMHNEGIVKIEHINDRRVDKGVLFSLQDCYLGQSELYHVRFDSFISLTIFDCHLQNIIPVGVKWNFNFKSYYNIQPEYLRETFKQLKNVCSKNMDKVSQLKFEKMEMNAYGMQLSWFRNFGDWFIFKTNKYSNQYGQNWLLALFWLFFISFILFAVICFEHGYSKRFNLGNYASFVMPFHNIREILCDGGNCLISHWVIFFDLLGKIFSGYFLFQFFRAFRKYVN